MHIRHCRVPKMQNSIKVECIFHIVTFQKCKIQFKWNAYSPLSRSKNAKFKIKVECIFRIVAFQKCKIMHIPHCRVPKKQNSINSFSGLEKLVPSQGENGSSRPIYGSIKGESRWCQVSLVVNVQHRKSAKGPWHHKYLTVHGESL